MIRLDTVVKKFDGFIAVNGISLEVPEGKTCVLVGPSGCGKTTTLRMINHLIEPTSGQIYINDENSDNIDPVELRRNIGYVIQSIGLFPHKTIADNIATTPRLKGWKEAEINERINKLLQMVGMDPDRVKEMYPGQLSGGQQQRVGLARAMAADPEIMLMDEPFAAVDPITREHLQNMFLKIQHKMKKTVVFVTHDIDEAIKMGDRIAIMQEGSLVQYDKPQTILATPKNQFVEEFVGYDRALKILNLFQVEDLMLTDPATISLEEDNYREKLQEASPKSVFVVIEEGQPVGWVNARKGLEAETIKQAINPLAGSVEITASVKEAVAEMLQNGIDAVQVLEDGKFKGLMTMYYIRNYVEDVCGTNQQSEQLEGVELSL